MSSFSLNEYRGAAKDKFRNKFIEYFSDYDVSKFKFKKLESSKLKAFINDNFKILNGKCISLSESTLLIAIYDEMNTDTSLTELLENPKILKKYLIKELPFQFPINRVNKDPKTYLVIENVNTNTSNMAAEDSPRYN